MAYLPAFLPQIDIVYHVHAEILQPALILVLVPEDGYQFASTDADGLCPIFHCQSKTYTQDKLPFIFVLALLTEIVVTVAQLQQ